MSTNLTIISGTFSVFIILFILFLIKKQKISIKYSLIWILLFILFIITMIIPGFLSFITRTLGFQIPSNMIFSLLIAVLIIINISMTIIVSNHDKKIRLLIQEISLLKGGVRNDK